MVVLKKLNSYGLLRAVASLNQRYLEGLFVPTFKEKTTIIAKDPWL
jgi:hypothetical protein